MNIKIIGIVQKKKPLFLNNHIGILVLINEKIKNNLEVGVLVVPLQPVWVWVSGRWPAWPVTKTFRSSSSLAPTYGINFSNPLLMPQFRKNLNRVYQPFRALCTLFG